jgi:hypothetical protein
MTDTIRERIITAIVTGLSAVRTAAGYATDIGAAVYRARTALDPDDAPLCNVFAGRDQATQDRYGRTRITLPVTVEAAAAFADDAPYTVEERLLGDLIEGMTATTWTLAFAAGSREIEVGDTVTGATSKATAYVAGVAVSTGSWAGGDAAGTLTLRRLTGAFAAESLKVGALVHAATSGAVTGQSAAARMTAGLAEAITYTEGGAVSRANLDATLTGVSAEFGVVYSTVAGNPYGQTA